MTAKKKPKTKSANSAAGKTTSSSKQQSKTPTKKGNSSTKQKIKTVGRPSKNNTKVSKSSGKREKDGEIKVGEIVSKNAQGVTKSHSPKKESKAFTLDDVRSILSTKKESTKKEKTKPTSKSDKIVKPKAKKGTAKVKKLTTASVDDILGFGGGPSVTVSKPIRDPKKVPKQWKSYYEDLMSLRASLKGALGERSSETIGASARESSGELSLNSSDAGTETFDRDVALSMVANEQEALNEIEEAIDRVFDGTFGICQETNKPIKKNRLKAVPFTRFSLEGQDLFEKRKVREGNNITGTFATLADSTLGTED